MQTETRLERILKQPLQIGGRTVASRLVLAPMTCLGHKALRRIIAGFGGCGLFFSEMCSAGRIPHENRETSAYFSWHTDEVHRLSIQIVGNDATKMARAAAIIEQNGLFGVDINLGCSAKAICRQHWGAALLQDTQRAVAVVKAVRRAVSCPLTVKFRTGWRDDPGPAVELARRLEDAGVDAITFHPRVAPDRRNRPPKWEYIAAVKDAVCIPVIGNGNVFSADDCLRMLQTTGCDAVALGRLAVCRPWVFAQWTGGDEVAADVAPRTALEMLELVEQDFDSGCALRRYKRYATYMAANFRFGNFLLRSVQNASGLDEIRKALKAFFDTRPEANRVPNTNLLV